jgi:hypothetical protein
MDVMTSRSEAGWATDLSGFTEMVTPRGGSLRNDGVATETLGFLHRQKQQLVAQVFNL